MGPQIQIQINSVKGQNTLHRSNGLANWSISLSGICLVLKWLCFADDPPPFIDGVRINSPHYLCKIKLGQNRDKRFTLVVSQYEKSHTIYYTLRAYGTSPFTLRKISEPYKFEKEVNMRQILLSIYICINRIIIHAYVLNKLTLGLC